MMDGTTLPIARSSLPEAAAERLRTLIIEGELAPGARLNERELSEGLGVSRTPLREAFRMLAADGLLVQLPNRGAQVVSLSREDVRHAFEVMASLEGLSGELAAARVTDADLDWRDAERVRFMVENLGQAMAPSNVRRVTVMMASPVSRASFPVHALALFLFALRTSVAGSAALTIARMLSASAARRGPISPSSCPPWSRNAGMPQLIENACFCSRA